jgi:hypothetical protein
MCAEIEILQHNVEFFARKAYEATEETKHLRNTLISLLASHGRSLRFDPHAKINANDTVHFSREGLVTLVERSPRGEELAHTRKRISE